MAKHPKLAVVSEASVHRRAREEAIRRGERVQPKPNADSSMILQLSGLGGKASPAELLKHLFTVGCQKAEAMYLANPALRGGGPETHGTTLSVCLLASTPEFTDVIHLTTGDSPVMIEKIDIMQNTSRVSLVSVLEGNPYEGHDHMVSGIADAEALTGIGAEPANTKLGERTRFGMIRLQHEEGVRWRVATFSDGANYHTDAVPQPTRYNFEIDDFWAKYAANPKRAARELEIQWSITAQNPYRAHKLIKEIETLLNDAGADITNEEKTAIEQTAKAYREALNAAPPPPTLMERLLALFGRAAEKITPFPNLPETVMAKIEKAIGDFYAVHVESYHARVEGELQKIMPPYNARIPAAHVAEGTIENIRSRRGSRALADDTTLALGLFPLSDTKDELTLLVTADGFNTEGPQFSRAVMNEMREEARRLGIELDIITDHADHLTELYPDPEQAAPDLRNEPTPATAGARTFAPIPGDEREIDTKTYTPPDAPKAPAQNGPK